MIETIKEQISEPIYEDAPISAHLQEIERLVVTALRHAKMVEAKLRRLQSEANELEPRAAQARNMAAEYNNLRANYDAMHAQYDALRLLVVKLKNDVASLGQ